MLGMNFELARSNELPNEPTKRLKTHITITKLLLAAHQPVTSKKTSTEIIMAERMKIILSNFDGSGYVWNEKDKETLQKEHRIVGKLIGEEFVNGLPLALLPEEVTLLKEKGIASLYRCPSLLEPPSAEVMSRYEERQKSFLQFQKEKFLRERQHEIEQRLNVIIEGKKKKMSASSSEELNRKAMYNEEIEKMHNDVNRVNPILLDTEDVYIEEPNLIDAEWLYPSTEFEKLKYLTFKDLWEKNYYLTSGAKFGGEFLCYTGDPKIYHSSFIIICKLSDSKISCKDLISRGRIGTSTRKTVVIATIKHAEDNQFPIYQSVQWVENKRFKSLT